MSEEPVLKLPNYQPQIFICERCKKVPAQQVCPWCNMELCEQCMWAHERECEDER